MLFLVKGAVRKHFYCHQEIHCDQEEFRIVEAEDDYEAEKKFEEHFKSKSEPYSVSYFVDDVEAHALIQ
jgi:hypothetical protein